MADTYDRVLAALTDVVAVEDDGPGLVQVVTISDVYRVDARHERCECKDFEYNLDGDGRCKHIWHALAVTDQVPFESHLQLSDDLDERPELPLPDFEDFDASAEVSYV